MLSLPRNNGSDSIIFLFTTHKASKATEGIAMYAMSGINRDLTQIIDFMAYNSFLSC